MPIINGAINFPKKIPNLNHILFGIYKILGKKKPKKIIKKANIVNNNDIKLDLPKKQKARKINNTKKTKAKLFSEGLFIGILEKFSIIYLLTF